MSLSCPMTKQFFTINEAAKLLGVSIKTLRRWETKGLIAPIRTVGNQRRYEVEAIYALTGKKSKTATRKEAIKQTKHLSLSESALHLGISEKTLRRWEKKGIISSLRDKTNQKMFLFKDLEGLKETKEQSSFPVIASVTSSSLRDHEVAKSKMPRGVQSQFEGRDRHVAPLSGAPRDDNNNYNNKFRFSPEFVHFPTRFALITIGLFASIVVIGGFGGFLAITKLPIQTLISHLPFNTKYQIQDTIYQNKVLQAATQARDFTLRINIPVEMLQTASVAGNLTAPNILYSVVAGDNITVTGDPQNPVISASGGVTSLGGGTGDLALLAGEGIEIDGLTITNADTGSSQNIFSSIKIDSTTLSAGSNTDTFELAAGSNVTLSTDTSNKKITISASGGSSGITGLEVLEGGTSLSDEITALDFLGGDFDVGESPSGQANIQLAATLNSVTGVSGNFSIGGTTTLNGITYTWPGSEGSNYILQTDGAGILTWIDPGSLPNTDKWDSIDGALVPKIITQDLLLGGVSTESARFHVYGSANSSGTPVASISGNTSDTTFIVDNTGTGDLFEAASSGMARFVISQNGTLQMMGGSAFTTTLTSAATQNRSIVFPDADGTLCLSSGNCAGVGGNGDVIGPGSSTDHALVRFDGTTGKQLQNSGIIIDDSNNITGVNSLSILPASNITSLTLTGTNVTSSNLAYFNANNSSGTIFTIDYGSTQTLTGALTGQVIDLNNGQLTATNQDVTGQRITLPTVTNTNAAGTVNLRGLQVNFGSGAGINQNGAGATVFSNLDVQLPALTQTQGSLTANGLAVTTPSSITTGGVANGLLISPTGVGAGTLHGVNIATISASGNGDETALHVGSGWDTVLRVNGTPVINGQGVTLATGGGTGQSTYATGDILYASATNTLSKLAIGGSDDYVLKVSGGVPVWGTISGDSCTTCVVTNPSATATNTIAPTGQDTTGLIVRQTSTASPTNDIFQVTDSSGSNVYFRVDEDGNVYPSNTIGDTLTLTPQTDTTALTLVGTNVTTANLQYINANNQSGTIFNLNYGASQTLSTTTPLNAIAVDLSTNVTATNANVTATNLTLPGATNTHTSGLKELTGVSIQAGGGINQNGAGGTTTFAAFDATIPALTQTDGTLNAYGLNVTTPSSITTGGTAAALNVAASGVGAGTLYGLNVGSITAGAGTETALNIGTGWDTVLNLNGTTIIDGSGNLNVANATGILPVANGGSPFEQAAGAIFPRTSTQDLLIGGVSTASATFHVYGAINAGTNPVASIAANTSFAGLVVDNTIGDLFTASSSGLSRFTVAQNGNIYFNSYNCSAFANGGVLTVDANGLILCEDDDGGAGGDELWETTNGAITQKITTQDLLIGGVATDSARFHVYGSANGSATPVASISGNTSDTALIVDNRGSGDLFRANSSGGNRFIITQSGNVGINTTNPTGILDIQQGSILSSFFRRTSGQYLELRNNASGNQLFSFSDSGNSKNLVFGIDANSEGFQWQRDVTTTGAGTAEMTLTHIGTLGIGTSAPTASLHVAAQTATFPLATFAGNTN
ncbi:MAG TPA: MerR family DNA-binding transcriptional regulator, partial [Patescibacteria group bacterium]|nr:MerR family DNA-binding transcriptional regulator [Patescibacteria group bacterium]